MTIINGKYSTYDSPSSTNSWKELLYRSTQSSLSRWTCSPSLSRSTPPRSNGTTRKPTHSKVKSVLAVGRTAWTCGSTNLQRLLPNWWTSVMCFVSTTSTSSWKRSTAQPSPSTCTPVHHGGTQEQHTAGTTVFILGNAQVEAQSTVTTCWKTPSSRSTTRRSWKSQSSFPSLRKSRSTSTWWHKLNEERQKSHDSCAQKAQSGDPFGKPSAGSKTTPAFVRRSQALPRSHFGGVQLQRRRNIYRDTPQKCASRDGSSRW